MEYLDKTASLTPEIKRIIVDKATEYPHTGQYNLATNAGTYLCRRCGIALFRAKQQFESGCGWPAFDEALPNRVAEKLDADGRRTEIICARCKAHLGHVFTGEYLTSKNLRHCVNSASLDYVGDSTVNDTEEALVAGGCFWGVEYFLNQLPGVLKAEVGYIGGVTINPDYNQVCQGNSGHYEGVRVVFDKEKTNYENVIKRFFEIHDPSQANGQGPDIGSQYQSAIFVYNSHQQTIAQNLIDILTQKGYSVATKLLTVQPFWAGETYHQQYYTKHPKTSYCHKIVKRFDN